MILGKEDSKCTGCGACANACTQQCIDIVADDEGFLYPQIDSAKCIECNVCSNVCHLNKHNSKKDSGKSFGAYSTSTKIRNNGSSGGLFEIIANLVLGEDGIVYGAAFSDDFRKLYHISTEFIGLNKLLKSKYLESTLGNTFSNIKENLCAEKQVLFCGTPCQVRGLVSYLDAMHISKKNLICVDFLCHGVLSEKAYVNYVDFMEKKHKSKVKSLSFRSKKLGWKTYCMYIEFENGKHYIRTGINDPYYRMFFECGSFRKSCYGCNYVENSLADITLGDFWTQSFDQSDKGVSFITVHSDLGNSVFSRIMDKITSFPADNKMVQALYSTHDYKRNIVLDYDYSKYRTSGIRIAKELVLRTRIGRFFVNKKRR